jgi:hypothetical protein
MRVPEALRVAVPANVTDSKWREQPPLRELSEPPIDGDPRPTVQDSRKRPRIVEHSSPKVLPALHRLFGTRKPQGFEKE